MPKANVLGEVGKGYKIAIETLNEGRIGIGAQMMGVARGAWEHALKYAQERKQFGKPIAEFQGIQFQLAQMGTEIEAARLMVYNAARMKDAGMSFVKEAAMTKLFASQVAERVCSLAVEIYGGYGFTKDYPVEKYFRDCKIGKIYEGTSNMQLADHRQAGARRKITAVRLRRGRQAPGARLPHVSCRTTGNRARFQAFRAPLCISCSSRACSRCRFSGVMSVKRTPMPTIGCASVICARAAIFTSPTSTVASTRVPAGSGEVVST